MPRKQTKSKAKPDSDLFIVEAILDKDVINGQPYYWLKWEGYPEEKYNTWEPKKNLSTCRGMLEKFEKEYQEDQKLFEEKFANSLKLTIKDLEEKLAKQKIEKIYGGLNRNGKRYVIVKWENEEELAVAPYDFIAEKMPERFTSLENFIYFK